MWSCLCRDSPEIQPLCNATGATFDVKHSTAGQACLLTSGLFASGIFSRRTLTMASGGYAGLAPGRGRDPNGNGPFDCYGVLAPDPA